MPLSIAECVQAANIRRQVPKAITDLANMSQNAKEIVCILSALGWMEPAAATRPGCADPATEVSYEVTVPPATYNSAGVLVPSEALVIPICAPINRSVVIDYLRVTAANLTAAEFGEVEFKKVNLGGVGEFCLPFEPDDQPGRFDNKSHIIMCPKTGFSVFAKNFSPNGSAVFHLDARMWSAC
jgi:hypothetical protein